MKISLFLAACFVALVCHSPAGATGPLVITYQGYLKDGSGTPVNSQVTLTFRLYDTLSGGIPIWLESRLVTPQNGIYSVELGTQAPLNASFFSTTNLYLGVQVGSDQELSPRQHITSVPFAIRADMAAVATTATNVSGGTVSATAISVGGSPVIDSSGRLTGAAAYTAPVGGGLAISNGAVTLSSQGCNTGQVLAWNAGTQSWGCADAGKSYSAGSGLSLNGNNQFSVDPNYTGFVRNQYEADQTTSFRIAYNGAIGGDLGVGTAAPVARLQAKGTSVASGPGTVTCGSTSSTQFIGTATSFLSQVQPGDIVTVNNVARRVVAVASDATLTVETPWGTTFSNASYTVHRAIARFTQSGSSKGMVVDANGNLHINEGLNPEQQLSINSNQIWKSYGAGDTSLYLQHANPGGAVVVGGAVGASNALMVEGPATVRNDASFAGGAVVASSMSGEGGVVKLKGSDGTVAHLESLNGTFRVVNDPWTAIPFQVDQSGNGAFQTSVDSPSYKKGGTPFFAVVAGGLCVNPVPNVSDSQFSSYGGAGCSNWNGLNGIATLTCPAGTTKWVLYKLTNAGNGGEGGVCVK